MAHITSINNPGYETRESILSSRVYSFLELVFKPRPSPTFIKYNIITDEQREILIELKKGERHRTFFQRKFKKLPNSLDVDLYKLSFLYPIYESDDGVLGLLNPESVVISGGN